MDNPGPGSGLKPGSVPRADSLSSERSKGFGINFTREKNGTYPPLRSKPESLSSERSKGFGINFKVGKTGTSPHCRGSSTDSGPKAESLSSEKSKGFGINFKDGATGPSSPLRDEDPGIPRGPEHQSELDAIFQRLEKNILTFVKEELQSIYRLLSFEHAESTTESTNTEEEKQSREAVLNITLDFLKRMEQELLAEQLTTVTKVGGCRDKLKSHLKHRFSQVFEGVAKAGNSAILQQIYTELYITEGGASEINREHEVIHIESASRRPAERAIGCEDIFKQRPDSQQPIRTVLTKGVAGVGKTVLTQKFSLDWAEGRVNQNIPLVFHFTFRDLNVIKERRFSLIQLLHHFFNETKVKLCSLKYLRALFIFDGLDECRLPLDFSRTRVLTDPTECASVGVLLVNLIRGRLLPSARIWITTRPAAANQIPAECISIVTEVRGFKDLQKEQYFIKRIRDEQQATAVISHIKSVHSLYIMCYIPIFCWILSTVLQKLLEQTEKPNLPKTLTEMYVHFLVVQAKIKNIKFNGGTGADLHWTSETKEMIWSLGKLAFEQLQKGNLIFYERDLRECGLDAAEIARHSGVFTEVFREESGLYQDKVYSFIHLSVQEFMAALHVHQTFFTSGKNLLSPSGEDPPDPEGKPDPMENLLFLSHIYESPDNEPTSEEVFYWDAVDQALESPNGHLDLFLRFLLGLSLPTNQKLLPGKLTQKGSKRTNGKIVKYIKEKLNEDRVSAERRMNLLHCLNELNDSGLLEQIQELMREGRLSNRDMSPAEWSAVCFIVRSSNSDLKEFDLRKYHTSEKAFLGLLPVVKVATKATLPLCGLTSHICGPLASVLSSSSLTHLDLSNNPIKDSGVKLLCEGLMSAPCRLETLRLSGCMVSEIGGASLAATLSSARSCLKELDLSYNNPGASTELLTALRAPQGPLHILSLDPAGECWMVPGLRKYSCEFCLDPNTVHKHLLLSEDKRIVIYVEQQQQYPHHKDRFTDWPQVLSSTGLRGRCYWEVDWTGEEADIAVSYRGIRRRGQGLEGVFGNDNQSWSLEIFDGGYVAHHNEQTIACSSFHHLQKVGRVGVFLDSEGGNLTFYEVQPDGGLFHLHTFVTSFTEPLFPGFKLWEKGSSVSLVNLNTKTNPYEI